VGLSNQIRPILFDLLDGIIKKKSGDEASHISAKWELAMYQIRWLNGN
jgi:hypothetical protein